jgi:CRISPR-associated endoribonuclease Cas6
MRLRLHLSPKSGEAILPKGFHYALGSTIHALSDPRGRHANADPRLFSVSPPLWKHIEAEDQKILLKGKGSIIFCSADTNQLNRIFNHREINIAGNLFELFRVEFIEDPLFESTMTWRVPLHGGIIAGYTEKETKKKYEFTPVDFPNETKISLERNLRSKWAQFSKDFPKRAVLWSAEENPSEWIKSQEIQVVVPNKNIITISQIRQTTVKAWRGRVTVTAPPPIQRLIWAAGLGQKAGCGFGFVEPYRPASREP